MHTCYWYLIASAYRLEMGGKRNVEDGTIAKLEGEMILTKGYNTEKRTKERLECKGVVRTIGVWIYPSGQQVTEYTFRMGQAKDFAKNERW